MDRPVLPPVREEKFSVEADFSGDQPRVYLVGVIDQADPGIAINPLLAAFHDMVMENGYDEVVLDLRELAYINSSGIKAVIRFILRIISLPPDRRYRVMFLHNSYREWQKSSFKPVTLLAPSFTRIEAQDPDE